MEFLDFLREHHASVQSEDDLWAKAHEMDSRNQRSLLEFLLSRKDLPQLMARIHKCEAAPVQAVRLRKTRLQLLEDACRVECTCQEPQQWIRAAEQVVCLSGYMNHEVQVAVFGALQKGRAKQRNIFIIGDTNRAKSFVLKPLTLIYSAFSPPDTGSHQLADLKGSEIIWLNDFEYDPSFLVWRKFKDFLEGSPLHVAVPKTQGSNYTFGSDAPVVGTSPRAIRHPDRKETQQMDSRIVYFRFHVFWDPQTCPEIKPCASCCAQWLSKSKPFMST
jgi:hypothetical protein